MGMREMDAGMAYGNQLLVSAQLAKRRSANGHMSASCGGVGGEEGALKAGYVPVDDVYFYKTGIRGHKKYFLYLAVFLLFLVALANLLTTFILLGVLHLGYGMQSMEFVSHGVLLRFLQQANMDVVTPNNGVLGGFHAHDLHLIGNDQSVIVQTKSKRPTAVVLNQEQTSLLNVNSFEVVDPNTGRQIFSTEYASFGLPKAVKKLNVHQVIVNKISSPVNRPLSLDSTKNVRMRGNEGLHMLGMEVVMTAGEDIFLKSRNGSIVLDGRQGAILRSVDRLPKSKLSSEDEPWQYKICVCMPSGKLFRIPIRQLDYNCANAVVSGRINPCL